MFSVVSGFKTKFKFMAAMIYKLDFSVVKVDKFIYLSGQNTLSNINLM